MKKRIFSLILILLFVFLLTGCRVELRTKAAYISPNSYEQFRIEMIAQVEKSVVVVKTETGHGSGVIFKAEPITDSTLIRYSVLTNYHVVEDGGEMKVHFGNSQNDINIVDYQGNERYDIAVVRFITDRVLRVQPIIPIEDSKVFIEILKGQDVYAIGTPQNIERFNYVTSGVVSLSSYPYNGINGLTIMHDAELNPGNSGGPLFNLNGDVIGINVAKVPSISTKDGVIAAEGLNYALSVNAIAPIVNGFLDINYETIVRKPRLGITVMSVEAYLNDDKYDNSLLPENPVGVVVVGFDLTRNAHLVMELYDLIIEINGTPVTQLSDISSQLVGAQFDDEHILKVLRKVGNEFVEFTVTIILS
jgi:S1-C subfamily serine protease